MPIVPDQILFLLLFLLTLPCVRYIRYLLHLSRYTNPHLAMAAINPPISSQWGEVPNRPLPNATISTQEVSAESQHLNPETIKPNNTNGMRRCRERPVRPSRRSVASANSLQSTAQTGLSDGEISSEAVKNTTLSKDEYWKTRWQEIDLPDELLQVPRGTRQEICAIVKESFFQSRAIRASLLDTNHEQKPPAKAPIERNIPHFAPELHTHDSSVMSRARTGSSQSDATASSRDSHRFSTGGQSFESFTSVESISGLPLSPRIAPLSPSLCTYEPGQEKRTKRRGLFSKLLRGKELKMKPVALKSSTSILAVTLETKECASCFEDVASKDAVRLGCQHSYCSPCFTQLVTTAMQHENFWPPKCCLQGIPKKTLVLNLSALELVNYSLKAKEYAIPAGERWYCSRAECLKWFERTATRRGDVVVTCTHCNFDMCLFCRGEQHVAGERCPQDRGLEATLAAADLEGWRRCYSCHTMVELNRGCRHITCTCGAQFWYPQYSICLHYVLTVVVIPVV